MDDKQTRTLRRTNIAAHDFERASSFIEAAAKHDIATLEHEALLINAVILYARPFSNNEAPGNRNPPADRFIEVDAASVLGDDYALHERIRDIRNKAVAHAEWEHYPTDRQPVAGTGHGIVMQSRRWHIVNERIELEAFGRIALTMRRLCQNRVADFGHPRFQTTGAE